MKCRTVFVAGALGAIGRPLVQLLLGKGWRVAGTTRDASRAKTLLAMGVTPFVVDVFDGGRLMQAVRAFSPDAVVHQLTDLPKSRDPARVLSVVARNAKMRSEGTANLVRACAAAGVPHLVAQSIAWAYAPTDGPAGESCPLDVDAKGARAVTVGGVMALEREVLGTQGVDGCVLRYGQVWGPGTGVDDPVGLRMPLHVEAAAWAALLALERHAVGMFNIAEDTPLLDTRMARRNLGFHPKLRIEAVKEISHA